MRIKSFSGLALAAVTVAFQAQAESYYGASSPSSHWGNPNAYVIPQEIKTYLSVKGLFSADKAKMTPVTGAKMKKTLDNGGVDAALGIRVFNNFRLELSYAGRTGDELKIRNGATVTDLTSIVQTAFVNGYIDFRLFEEVHPYIGGGIGYSHIKYETKTHAGNTITKQRESGSDKAWNAMAGIGIKLNDGAYLDFGYRYVDAGSFSKNTREFKTTIHEGIAGVRFEF